jgi:hypothetical protein
MNDKTSPNQMRVLLRRMHGEKYVVTEDTQPKKDLNIRDMLKITRKLNEDINNERKAENKKTVYDQSIEEDKFIGFFKDMNVNIKFIDLEVYDNLIFWGGTIDGIIQFIYKVTPDESTSGVEFNYLEDFSPDNPDNDLIVKMVEDYYDNNFYKYWRNNLIQQ